jgi:hypothetical protein
MCLNLAGNISFFLECVTSLPSMVLAANIFSKTIGISEYGQLKHFFLNYRTIGILNIGPLSQENYRTIGNWIPNSNYRTIGYRK